MNKITLGLLGVFIWLLCGFTLVSVMTVSPLQIHNSSGYSHQVEEYYAQPSNTIQVSAIVSGESPAFERYSRMQKRIREEETREAILNKINKPERDYILNRLNLLIPVEYFIAIGYTESEWYQYAMGMAYGPNKQYRDRGTFQISSQYQEHFVEMFWDITTERFNVFNHFHNMYLAAKILNWLYVETGFSLPDTIKAYNIGLESWKAGAKAVKANEYLRKVQRFVNLKGNLKG